MSFLFFVEREKEGGKKERVVVLARALYQSLSLRSREWLSESQLLAREEKRRHREEAARGEGRRQRNEKSQDSV